MPTISMKINGTWTDVMSYNTSTSSLIKPLAFSSGGSGTNTVALQTFSKGPDATSVTITYYHKWGPVVSLSCSATTPAVTDSWSQQKVMTGLPKAVANYARGFSEQRDTRYVIPCIVNTAGDLVLTGMGGAAWSSKMWYLNITYLSTS